MNIYEAATLAKKKGCAIYRGDNMQWCRIVPTDSSDCCKLYSTMEPGKVGVRWQPQAKDLLATDWDICPLPPNESIGWSDIRG